MKLMQLRIRENPEIGDAYFFLDNSAVVDGLLGIPPASSQHAYIKFGKLAEQILPRKTIVTWVPGHKDVPSNEVADRLAKEGSELPTYNQNYTSITNVKRWATMRKKLEHESFWHPNPPGCRRWKLDAPAPCRTIGTRRLCGIS
jgi:hypothetical protein